MKNRFIFIVALIVGASLLGFMFFFQVRYDEIAIRTTFDKAEDDSVIKEPGLHFKLPWPIHDVKKYTKRLQILEDELRQEPTKDNQVLTLRTYMTWVIDEDKPLDFYVTLENLQNADALLRPILNNEMKTVFTQYNFDQMVNLDKDKIKLPEMEQKALAAIQQRVESLKYGVIVKEVGIQKLVMPQENTQTVFDRMVSVRDRMAADAEASGKSQAASIKKEAETARERIMAFARRRAIAIRAKGEDEAAEYYKAFQKEPELAIFLRRVETIRNANWENATILLDSTMLAFTQLFDAATAKSNGDDVNPLAVKSRPSTTPKTVGVNGELRRTSAGN